MKQSNAQSLVQVTASELPLHCPPAGSALWNSHPRVFIPLEEAAECKCPYCGTVYRLVEHKTASTQSIADNAAKG